MFLFRRRHSLWPPVGHSAACFLLFERFFFVFFCVVIRTQNTVTAYLKRFHLFNSFLLSQCIDGKKTIEPQCQWSGLVVLEKGKPPQLLRLTVAKKYCSDRPDDKVVDC